MDFSQHPAVKNLINKTFKGRYLGPDENVFDCHKIEVNAGSLIERHFDRLRNVLPPVNINTTLFSG